VRRPLEHDQTTEGEQRGERREQALESDEWSVRPLGNQLPAREAAAERVEEQREPFPLDDLKLRPSLAKLLFMAEEGERRPGLVCRER
jgi:hypothetical protein